MSTEAARGLTIITGAAGAIGAAVASALADITATLVLVDRDEVAVTTLADSLASRTTTVPVVADVSSEDDVAHYVEVARSHGQITGFFNNAGIEGWIGPITEYPVSTFEAVLAVNVKGVFLGLKHVLQDRKSVV